MWIGGDDISAEDFKSFLTKSAFEVAGKLEAIQGHFRHAGIPFREEEGDVDYASIYMEQSTQLAVTGIVC